MINFLLFLTASEIPDEFFAKQFQFNDTGLYGHHTTEDINILPAWSKSLTGKGINISIVGNGCFVRNPDLSSDRHLQDYDFNLDDNNTDISPTGPNADYTTRHMTLAVGASNKFCTIGAAYEASYFCLKSTQPDHHHVSDALARGNDQTHIKILTTPERCDSYNPPRGDFKKCPVPKHHGRIEKTLAQYPDTIFVVSAGIDGRSFGDPNHFPVAKNPSVITVADTTANGLHAYWSNEGTAITVNAPAGGAFAPNDENSINNEWPHPPSSGKSNTTCDDSLRPQASSTSVVAGAIALILQKNPELKPRDVSAILALTATKNDAASDSWVKNGFGLDYSPKYGFGRIDTSLATEIAENWNLLPKQSSRSLFFSKISFPETRSGVFTTKATYTTSKSDTDRKSDKISDKNDQTDINFIENVVLEFSGDALGLLEVEVASPAGTTFPVVRPSTVDDSNETVHYTIRGFLGENPEGQWTIRAIRHGYAPKGALNDLKLTIMGTNVTVPITIPTKPDAFNFRLSPGFDSIEVQLNYTSKVECNKTIKGNIIGATFGPNDVFEIYLKNQTSHSLAFLATTTKPEFEVALPCTFANGSYWIYVENRQLKLKGEAEVKYENTRNTIIRSPDIFDTIRVEDNTFQAAFDASFADSTISDGPLGVLLGIYDFEKQQDVFRQPYEFSELNNRDINKMIKISISNIGGAVLYIVPQWTKGNGCATAIQTLFFLKNHEEEPNEFLLPLPSCCPVPEGINNKNIQGANKAIRIVWIGCVCAVMGISMAVALVWHFTCRQKSGATYAGTSLDFNTESLLESKN